MNQDMTVSVDGGIINIRAGAIIIKDGKFLMAGNHRSEYLYSVGGRVRFGETAKEAVVREVEEETGVRMEIDRLGFIHENYFMGDTAPHAGKLFYEISFYFYMKVPENFNPVGQGFTGDGSREYLKWVSAEEEQKLYPEFFRDELTHPENSVKHFVTDERKKR